MNELRAGAARVITIVHRDDLAAALVRAHEVQVLVLEQFTGRMQVADLAW